MPGFSGLSNQACDLSRRLAFGCSATIALYPFRRRVCMTHKGAAIHHRPQRVTQTMGEANGAIYPDLAGKTVVVTGGASGIGETIVSHFARQKAKVGFLDIKMREGAGLVGKLAQDGGEVHFEACDLVDTEALKTAIAAVRARFGAINILINNAGHDERHVTEEVTSPYFDERIAINLKHQFFAAHAVLGDMKALGGGSIINLGSTS